MLSCFVVRNLFSCDSDGPVDHLSSDLVNSVASNGAIYRNKNLPKLHNHNLSASKGRPHFPFHLCVAPLVSGRPPLKAQCESRKKLRSQQTRDRWLTWMFIRVFFAKTHFIMSPPSLVCLAHWPVYKPSMAIKTRPLQNSLPSFVIQTFMDWWRRDEGATETERQVQPQMRSLDTTLTNLLIRQSEGINLYFFVSLFGLIGRDKHFKCPGENLKVFRFLNCAESKQFNVQSLIFCWGNWMMLALQKP